MCIRDSFGGETAAAGAGGGEQKPVKLFDEHPEVRERWQNKLRLSLIHI